MDVKLSSNNSSKSSTTDQGLPGKQLDFCDNLSEHGYGSLEDLQCPDSPLNTSPLASPPSPSPVRSADSIVSSQSGSFLESSQQTSLSSEKESILPQRNVKMTGDCNDSNIINNIRINFESSLASVEAKYSNTTSNHNNISGDNANDQKVNDDKVYSPSTPLSQSGNRFRFVPKQRQANSFNDRQQHKSHYSANGRNNNNRGSRKNNRNESENRENENKMKCTPMRNKNNEDIVFIIKRVDRSLRRTVSESSSEALPVRGILKYPRGWNRRTLSESSCDNSDQSNLLESHEKGHTQSLECISPLEASCEASTESACSSAGESPGHEEDKPKKSVHFNCYVSKATFNINSTILNNKQPGSNRKKNRRRDANSSNSNIANSTKPNSNHKTNNCNNSSKQPQHAHHHNNHNHQSSNNNHHQQLLPQQTSQQTNQERNNSQPKKNHIKVDKQPGDIHGNKVSFITDPVCEQVDKEEQNLDIDPSEIKMRSRQDSGYDSETCDRKGCSDIPGTTCVKSPKRQFTVKKVNLN